MKKIKLNKGLVALVDDEDYEKVSRFTWCAHLEGNRKQPYAVTSILQENGRYKQFRMHRMVMEVYDPKIIVDHKNGNTLDNRRKNLRLASFADNSRNQTKLVSTNTSGFRGVSYYKVRSHLKNPWGARIKKDGILRHLGYFEKSEDAAKAFDIMAKKLFKGFHGRLNFE